MPEHKYIFQDGDVWDQRKLDFMLSRVRHTPGARLLAGLTPAKDLNGDPVPGMSNCRLYEHKSVPAPGGPKAA